MTNVKNKTEILKVILLVYTIFACLIFFVGETNCSPQSAMNAELQRNYEIQNVINLIDQKEYKQAFNALEQIENVDMTLINYNSLKFKELLKEYKKILIDEANAYSSGGDYAFALNLLNSRQKYYKDDENINALITYNTNQIKSKNLVAYNGEVEHLFTHCLLAFPEMALNPKNPLSTDFDRDCLTPSEFKKILLSLYNNNYVLVDINSVYENVNGVCKKKTLYLPAGKKPLIFSFDDCNYDSKKKNKGMVDKIILDRNNNIATYTSKQTIAKRVSYDNEFIPILENFVKTYPDFSHNGAKGLICLTGYDGILGYRTQKSNATSRFEIKKAQEVVNRLKDLGWKFACHSYGHYHMKKISDMEFAKEVNSWQNEVEPIIGKTNIYVYPYGEWEVTTDDGNISYKHKLLLDSGFELFCGVGAKTFFSYVPIGTKDTHTLFMDRKPIDGRTLRQFGDYYAHLFDAKQVYDHTNRTVPFNS